MAAEQLREGERPGGSLGSRVLRTKTTVKDHLWKEKMDFGEKLRKNLQITLKRDIIVVRTNRFWYDNGAFWYCNCCYEIVKNHLKMCKKISVATTTPIRFRSCLGTTTRTPTPLRWFVPLSTSLRTANYSSKLKSAWGAVQNNSFYRLCW